MPPTYSYDPSLIGENPIYKMRFELGDTTFAPGELTAALCDEEYKAVLDGYKVDKPRQWKKAKRDCLERILMKFAHQVDVSIDGLSYSFSDRIKFWKSLYDDLKKELTSAVPIVNPNSLTDVHGGHYFHKDMMKNW